MPETGAPPTGTGGHEHGSLTRSHDTRQTQTAAALSPRSVSARRSISSYVHYKLLTDPSYTSFCDVNATVSCTQAYLSRYGSFWGVPVALGGVLFFALVLRRRLAGRRRPSSA